MGDRAFIRGRVVWLSWHPGRRGLPRRGWDLGWELVRDRWEPWRDGWFFYIGMGRLLFTLGPGTPSP